MSDAMMIGDTAMRSLWSDPGDDEGHWPADSAGTSLPTRCVNLAAYPYEVRGETYHEGLSVSLRREPGLLSAGAVWSLVYGRRGRAVLAVFFGLTGRLLQLGWLGRTEGRMTRIVVPAFGRLSTSRSPPASRTNSRAW